MTADPRTGAGDAGIPPRATDVTKHHPVLGDSLTGNARCRRPSAGERGTARTAAHSSPDTYDRKAAP